MRRSFVQLRNIFYPCRELSFLIRTMPTYESQQLSHHFQQAAQLIFIFGYPLFFILESFFAAQTIPPNRWRHAGRNIVLGLVNLALLGSVSFAVLKTSIFFSQFSFLPGNYLGAAHNFWIAVGFVIFYDFTNYWIHRSLHLWNRAWKFHRLHHTDTYIDVTSAFYFNPLESLYRGLIQLAIVSLMGLPILVLAMYQAWVVFALLFSHSNLRFPARLEKYLKYILVLPTVHRVHHSYDRIEHDSNYGIGLMIWDHLFGSFTEATNENQFKIGLR